MPIPRFRFASPGVTHGVAPTRLEIGGMPIPRFRFASPGVTHGVASARLLSLHTVRLLNHVTQHDNHPNLFRFTQGCAALAQGWYVMPRWGFCRFAAVLLSANFLFFGINFLQNVVYVSPLAGLKIIIRLTQGFATLTLRLLCCWPFGPPVRHTSAAVHNVH